MSSGPSTENRWVHHLESDQDWDRWWSKEFDDELTEAEYADIWGSLNDQLAGGVAGDLRFAGYPLEARQMEMAGHRHILELRPLPEAKRRFGRDVKRLVRFYYAEPADPSDVLLGLHLASKPNGPDPHGEQNQAIVEAGARAERWNNEDHLAVTAEEGA